jgi:methylated-DNA-[protein]-cysteine S-methyltransferase
MRSKSSTRSLEIQVATFASELGWMAIAGVRGALSLVTFGHRRQRDALARCSREFVLFDEVEWHPELAGRLQAFAAGDPQDFRDVKIQYGQITPFGRKVFEACRRIPCGETTSYARLAEKAGRKGAARAVGNWMATNRWPLVIPCHRVICANGSLGEYSMEAGPQMKRQLLRMESAAGLKLA